MYVYVVTGKAGHIQWPAKVFKCQFAAHLFALTAPAAAKSCRQDRLNISHTQEYSMITNPSDVEEVERVILQPFSLMDPECPVDPAIWHLITYSVEQVALHD